MVYRPIWHCLAGAKCLPSLARARLIGEVAPASPAASPAGALVGGPCAELSVGHCFCKLGVVVFSCGRKHEGFVWRERKWLAVGLASVQGLCGLNKHLLHQSVGSTLGMLTPGFASVVLLRRLLVLSFPLPCFLISNVLATYLVFMLFVSILGSP